METPAWRKLPVVSKSGKKRETYAPNRAMRMRQDLIVDTIRSCSIEMPSAFGGVREKGTADNVSVHRKADGRFRRFYYLLDLSSAYNNTTLSTILVHLKFKYPETFTNEFIQMVMNNCLRPGGGLITGASASPDLFNLYMEVFVDEKLREYAKREGLVYSRFVDDLTFSSESPFSGSIRNHIVRLLMDAGCVINHGKVHILDLSKHPVSITGIGIDLSGKMFVPRKKLFAMKELVRRAIEKGDVPSSQVHGTFGLFVYLMERNRIDFRRNKAETKVFDLYQKFKTIEKRPK